MTTLERKLHALGADIHGPLEEITVPMYALDSHGTIVWLNNAAERIAPGARGRKFSDLMTPDQVHPAKRLFALRILGRAPFTDHTAKLRTPTGGVREVEVSSVPLKRKQRIVGVFGVLRVGDEEPPRRIVSGAPALTPRQHEVLTLLGMGLTTIQMADRMGVAPETVQNHVKALLRQLRVKSRLEAVLAGYRLGLLTERDLPIAG